MSVSDVPHGNCVVCQDALGDDSDGVSQLDCGHEFHTHCILGWFRSQQSRCPLCARTGGAYIADEDDATGERADMQEIRRFAASPGAPQWLKLKLCALQAARQKLAEQQRQLALFKRQAVPVDMSYADAFKRVRLAQTKTFVYRRNVWRLERFVRRRVRVSTVVITRQRAAPCRRSSRLAVVH